MPNKNNKEDAKLLSTLGILGISAVGVLTVGCAGAMTAAIINNPPTNTTAEYIKKGEGLPLAMAGGHLRAGKHNAVITDQFYDILTFDDTKKERQEFAINAIKEAYTYLNDNFSGVSFNLCTNSERVANRFYLPLVNSIGSNDIAIQAQQGILPYGTKNTMGQAYRDYDHHNLEAKNMRIVFSDKCLFKVWKTKNTLEETLDSYNSELFTFTIHEMGHMFFFDHITTRDSIMNPSIGYSTSIPNEEDLKMFDKYSVQFYDAPAKYAENAKEPINNNAELSMEL